MKRILIVLVALVTLSAVPVSAQTYLRTTTLTNAITATQTQFILASGTGVAAGGGLYIDHEFIPILSCAVAACTTVNVARSQKPNAHGAAAVVYVASVAAKPFTILTHMGAQRAGVCSTSTSGSPATALAGIQYLPIIDIDTGDQYNCRRNGTNGTWVWNVTNVLNVNGTAGSSPTAWP